MEAFRDGRFWRIGTAADVSWISGRTSSDIGVTTAVPPVFDAYATFYAPSGIADGDHERAVVDVLSRHSADQPWWLGYLDTGAHDVVFPDVPMVSLYWRWPYVLVEAGPHEALTWRTGHMRSGSGALPDLFFPADRSWLVSALWDDAWTCVGGSVSLIDALRMDPSVAARRVTPDEDALPPGFTRE